MSYRENIEFEVGQTILYKDREYIIVEVQGERTIRVGIGELDLGGKDILKKALKENPDDPLYCIARWFIIQKKITHSNYKSVRSADPEKHKDTLRKMIDIDGLEPIDIIDILHYALMDMFWKENLLTIKALRAKSNNGMLKWENIRKSLTMTRKRGEL